MNMEQLVVNAKYTLPLPLPLPLPVQQENGWELSAPPPFSRKKKKYTLKWNITERPPLHLFHRPPVLAPLMASWLKFRCPRAFKGPNKLQTRLKHMAGIIMDGSVPLTPPMATMTKETTNSPSANSHQPSAVRQPPLPPLPRLPAIPFCSHSHSGAG